MTGRSDNVRMLVDFIISQGRGALFHVTDEVHLASIAQRGLLSKRALEENGISPDYPGGNSLTRALDQQYGLWDYVFLGFTAASVMPAHRHERRSRKPRTLFIHPEILHGAGVKIALGRANHRDTKCFGVSHAVRTMDGEAFFAVATMTHDPNDLAMKARIVRAFNYEILVPARVPPEYIIGIA